MQLINLMAENSRVALTGRLNVLGRDNGQFFGAIYFKNGFIVNTLYKSKYGKRSLRVLLIDSCVDENKFKFAVEPEVSDQHNEMFSLKVEDVIKSFSDDLLKFKKNEKLAPPTGTIFSVNPDYIISGGYLTSDESHVLGVISEYPILEDIFSYCGFSKFEIIDILIGLRRKGALKVKGIGKKKEEI